MKITTWNVDGLRAALNKGAIDALMERQPDVLMLQEIKASAGQLSEDQNKRFDGYAAQWNSAEKPGYSGVASFFKSAPDETALGLGIGRFDREGRLIALHYPEFSVINVYVPSGQRDYGRVLFKLDFYAALLELCKRLHAAGRGVIIGGDFNTAHRPIDLRNPTQNRQTSGFLPEEREWIDRFLEHGLVDIYRTLYPEKVEYTWWTAVSNARARDVGWRLDYFLVSEALAGRVKEVRIEGEIFGSDHCPVTVELS